jgi:hypothetical protein
MNFDQQFLHDDYFYAHSEPHRRRPTICSFPRLIVHTATYYQTSSSPRRRGWFAKKKPDPLSQFRVWLGAFEQPPWLRCLDDGERERFEPAFLDRFSRAYEMDERGAGPALSTGRADFEFMFEASCDHNGDDIIVRVERHAEYFTLTIFAPLDQSKCSLIDYYGDAQAFVPSGIVAQEPKDPFHALFWRMANLFPRCTFANFRGIVAHAGCLPPAENGAKPRFGDFDRINNSHQVDEARETEFYLRAQKDRLAKSVFFSGDRDAIACYMQNGQVLYVSSLGTQRVRRTGDTALPCDELRYLVLYEEPGAEQKLSEAHRRMGGRDENRERFRLSRLVHRINTIGTLRLAALRELRALRLLNEELKKIELALEPALRAPFERRDHGLMAVIRRLESLGSSQGDGVPVFYRSSRAQHYFKQLDLLVEDLNIGDIPDWQNYRQFVRRRLYASLEFNANFGRRVIELWQLARSRAEFIESRTLLFLQDIAAAAAVTVVPLTVADTLMAVELPFLPTLFVSGAIFFAYVLWARRFRGPGHAPSRRPLDEV